MPNTDEMQRAPDCVPIEPWISSNPRYRHFCQRHFTAGDEEQFIRYWDASPSDKGDLTPSDVFDTFGYIFHNMKKGIYVRIVDGEVRTFLPFSKVDYHNAWHPFFGWNKKRFATMDNMFSWICRMSGRQFRSGRIHRNVQEWYANDGLIRCEHPISEGDSGVNMIRDMIMTLSQERRLPDADFFINKRDFPLVSKDPMRHPYHAMFPPDKGPCLIGPYRPKIAVLGMTTTDDHADIPIPTWEDWCRASYQADGRVFPKEMREFPRIQPIPWDQKKRAAVFRGASTGLGTTGENNPRLMASLLSINHPDILDAGITKWNLRPRRPSPDKPFDTIDQAVMNALEIKPYMSLQDQAGFRLILHLPGHSCAYRLSYELSTGSAVMIYPCEHRLWFSHMLRPWVHYVPIDPSRPLIEQIEECLGRDEDMKKIAQNALDFYNEHLDKDAILDHLEACIRSLPRVRYPSTSIRGFTSVRMDPPQQPPIIADIGAGTELMRTRSTVVRLHGEGMCSKTTKDCDFRHENLIGSRIIRPWNTGFNQAHGATHGITTNEDGSASIIMDYVPGRTMDKWIQSPWSSTRLLIRGLLEVLMQACLIVDWGQDMHGFAHMDMYAWNLMIRPVVDRQPLMLPVFMKRNDVWDYTTIIMPRPSWRVGMIDFGRSSGLIDGVLHQNCTPAIHSRMHDILTLMINSVYLILRHHNIPDECREADVIRDILRIIMPERIRSINSIMKTLAVRKKFSRMLWTAVVEPMPRSMTPLDVFFRLHEIATKRLSTGVMFNVLNHPHREKFDLPDRPCTGIPSPSVRSIDHWGANEITPDDEWSDRLSALRDKCVAAMKDPTTNAAPVIRFKPSSRLFLM